MSCIFPGCSFHAPDGQYCPRHKPKGEKAEKKVYVIPKVSEKNKAKESTEKAHAEELNLWFIERRKELTGVCEHCGGKTCKDDPKRYKYSIAHILPKNLFKSIATHPLNFIELCFWNTDCHGNYDRKMIEIQDLKCWPKIVERFKAMYPSIAKDELKYIPDILLQEL